ncbi:hypothetical protein [Microbacterium timonense]|uniref:hypothetical protein n=1 Tax=Microbacterium timonense TaxID=2086576 RepID=UPI000D10BF3D|nr:hypothetical protein [Microbacterium timonense]
MSGEGAGDPLDPQQPSASRRVDPDTGWVGLFGEMWPRVDHGLQIRGGGAVAVDTVTLRETADRFVTAEADLEAIALRLGALQNMLLVMFHDARDAVASASILGTRLREVRAEALAIAGALRGAADAYELVDLRAEQHAAALAGDTGRAARLEARTERLAAAHPDAWQQALIAEFDRTVLWPSELVRQSTQWGVSVGETISGPGAVVTGAATGLVTLGAAAGVGLAGTGRLSRDARLTGTAGPVSLRPVAPVAPTAPAASSPSAPAVPAGGAASVAPQGLAAVTQRMPGAGDSRVRVERYAMPDGSHQYAVYVAGMQSFALGGDDPWDNESNLQLYSGQTSDSYAATEAALAAAGAQPGDVVHAFGHSQGAMIAAHLALEGEYDVQTLVSLGSPVEADVGADTFSVTLRHTDDPVAALAGGGHGQGVGAPGSFVAERVADPDPGLDDVQVPAHRMTAYAETAVLVDASADPRVDQLRAVFDGLAAADDVVVTEYAATRG